MLNTKARTVPAVVHCAPFDEGRLTVSLSCDNPTIIIQSREDNLRKLLKVPEPYTLIALLAAGYSDEKPAPKKKSLDEVTFFNKVIS